MKRFLCAGEGSAPFPTNINFRLPRYFPALRAPFLYILVLFMCLPAAFANESAPVSSSNRAVSSFDPQELDSITPLYLGDPIPEAIWNLPLQVVNNPQGKDVITLGDYRDKKLIILNFWATYCKPCVASIEKIAEILPELSPADQAILIPVQVYDTRERAISFMDKRQWSEFTVVDDTVLNMQVLIRYLSGYGVAFIKDGRLYALPRKKYITKENLQRILLDQVVEMENIQNKKFLNEGEKR